MDWKREQDNSFDRRSGLGSCCFELDGGSEAGQPGQPLLHVGRQGVQTELNLTMEQFLEAVRATEGPIVDLRR
jgi:hypothetical protein